MLWTILVVFLILWLLGFSLHVGGGLIHLLLVVGLVVLVINLLSGRRSSSYIRLYSQTDHYDPVELSSSL